MRPGIQWIMICLPWACLWTVQCGFKSGWALLIYYSEWKTRMSKWIIKRIWATNSESAQNRMGECSLCLQIHFLAPPGVTTVSTHRTGPQAEASFCCQHGCEHDASSRHLARGGTTIAAGSGGLSVKPSTPHCAMPRSQRWTAHPQQQPSQHKAPPQQIQRGASHSHQRETEEQ